MIPNLKQMNILDILDMYGEDSCREVLSSFICPLNMDIAVSSDTISKTLKRRISKFSQYDAVLNRHLISMPLIAQLGRNYSESARKYPVSGNELLDLAFQNIKKAQRVLGGKTTYIECASNSKLYDFYTAHGFVPFGERKKDNSELCDGPVFTQMLRYF